MTTDREPSRRPTHSRRAILGGAAAGAAALGLRAIAGPEVARAGGTAIYRNQDNSISQFTSIDDEDGGSVFFGDSPVTMGVDSHLAAGTGIDAYADGQGATAIAARSTGLHTQIAIHAIGTTEPGEGYAVKAETKNGIALYGSAVGGYALQVQGNSVFSRSGVATVKKGNASKTVTLAGHGNSVTTSSFIVATIQGHVSGTWVEGVTPDSANNRFTIHLNRAASADVNVGWFVIN